MFTLKLLAVVLLLAYGNITNYNIDYTKHPNIRVRRDISENNLDAKGLRGLFKNKHEAIIDENVNDEINTIKDGSGNNFKYDQPPEVKRLTITANNNIKVEEEIVNIIKSNIKKIKSNVIKEVLRKNQKDTREKLSKTYKMEANPIQFFEKVSKDNSLDSTDGLRYLLKDYERKATDKKLQIDHIPDDDELKVIDIVDINEIRHDTKQITKMSHIESVIELDSSEVRVKRENHEVLHDKDKSLPMKILQTCIFCNTKCPQFFIKIGFRCFAVDVDDK